MHQARHFPGNAQPQGQIKAPISLGSPVSCIKMFYLMANMGHKEVTEHLLKVFFFKACCNPTICASNKGLRLSQTVKIIARMLNSLLT